MLMFDPNAIINEIRVEFLKELYTEFYRKRVTCDYLHTSFVLIYRKTEYCNLKWSYFNTSFAHVGSYNIDVHDYTVRLKAALKFLKAGDKVVPYIHYAE